MKRVIGAGPIALHLKLLGELVVLRDDEEIDLPHSKKTRALLAYLAAENRRVRRDHLCDMFWEVPADPRASLRWSLSMLRRLFEESGDELRLRTDQDGVMLVTDGVDLDIRRVIGITAETVNSFDAPSLEMLATSFRGRFLEGLELPRCPQYEAWRIFHTDALERIRALILRALIERLPTDSERSIAHAHTLRALDPAAAPAPPQARPVQSNQNELELRTTGKGGFAGRDEDTRSPRSSQQIRYCRSPDGVQIAYAISGKGPPILRAAHWMSHLQYEWESPVWRHWIGSLSRANTLIRYDERGNGLSDWTARDLSFDAMVADLESVADASGLGRFPLLGVSQSCAVSVAYAVRHPERVSHLVLYGGYAKGWRRRADRSEIETHEAMTTLIREGWGKENPAFRQLFAEMFIPGASREQMEWFNDLQKKSSSPINASRLHDAFGEMDVSDLLGDVRVPTLVLHSRSDVAVPFGEGKALAAGIRGARLVDLNSANHILLDNEPAFADFLRETTSFIQDKQDRISFR